MRGRPPLLLRLICFILCVPSGFAIMVKVYGVLDMQTFVLAICLPFIAVLLIITWRLRSKYPELATVLAIGAIAGLFGAVAYDVVRIPAALAGYRVFGTISVFGLWLLDAEKSPRFTELAGWSYNYFNGFCFGMMYTLLMRGRHWIFGVLWALILETIALATPFGLIFNIRGNVPVQLIAYGAHVAYGFPLGRAVQKWQDTREALEEMPFVARITATVIAILVLTHSLFSPGAAATDGRAAPAKFRVEGLNLNPEWLRISRGRSVSIVKDQGAPAAIVLQDPGAILKLEPHEAVETPPFAPGIHQLFVETPGRTRSSFIVVEPVELIR